MSGSEAIRRGVALLIVLVTLVLVTAAVAGLARAATTAQAGRTLGRWSDMADDLLAVADGPIRQWLKQSDRVVLSPDAEAPRVLALNDLWVAGDVQQVLRITAWDQCGMPPVSIRRSGSPLRSVVPPEILRVIDETRLEREGVVGLDLFQTRATRCTVAVFPELLTAEPVRFGGPVVVEAPPPTKPRDETPQLPIGAFVATHNPGALNLNTAPIALIEQALRQAGRGGIEQVIAARQAGEVVRLSVQGGTRQSNAMVIGPGSRAWALRIDVSVGRVNGGAVCRSWWAVYTRSKGTWKCVQRLAITE